jgi:hypothetical protein
MSGILLGKPEDQSTMGVREILSEEEVSNFTGLETDFELLQSMDLSFSNAIQQVVSARQNIDREISSFKILDDFLYDPNNVQKIDQYRNRLATTIGTTDLNPVNSSMALGTQAVLEIVKFAKEADPQFQVLDLEQKLTNLETEAVELTAESNLLEFQTQLSGEVVVLAKNVETKHETLQSNLAKYSKDVIRRNPMVERTFKIISSLDLPLPHTSNVHPTELEARAGHNTLIFMTSCLRN